VLSIFKHRGGYTYTYAIRAELGGGVFSLGARAPYNRISDNGYKMLSLPRGELRLATARVRPCVKLPNLLVSR
jgi:hypothetical protein